MLSPFSSTPTSPKFSHEETVIFLKKSVQTVERNFSFLEKALDSYSKHQMQTQTKSIKVAACLDILAEHEADASTKQSLLTISKLIQQKEMVRGELFQRIDIACVEPLTAYSSLCSKMMDNMKAQKNAIQFQKKKRDQVDQVLLKESGELGRTNSSKLSKSQMELAEATGQVSSCTEVLQDAIYRFDDQRREDLKRTLEELIYAEMKFHTQALEILTDVSKTISNLD